jgi:hypothetical protein
VLPATFSNGPNIISNETQTNEFSTNIQTSLKSQRSLHLYIQQKAQPDHIPTKIPFVYQPLCISSFPTKLLISQNVINNETQTSDFTTSIEGSLDCQPTVHPYTEEKAQP